MTTTRKILAGLAAGVAVAAALPATAQAPTSIGPSLPSRDCFLTRDWEGWSSPAPDTVYLDVRGDIYKVNVLPYGRSLDKASQVLVSRTFGTERVCNPRDLDLRVVDRFSGFVDPLFPVAIARLSDAEAQAVPVEQRPGVLRSARWR